MMTRKDFVMPEIRGEFRGSSDPKPVVYGTPPHPAILCCTRRPARTSRGLSLHVGSWSHHLPGVVEQASRGNVPGSKVVLDCLPRTPSPSSRHTTPHLEDGVQGAVLALQGRGNQSPVFFDRKTRPGRAIHK